MKRNIKSISKNGVNIFICVDFSLDSNIMSVIVFQYLAMSFFCPSRLPPPVVVSVSLPSPVISVPICVSSSFSFRLSSSVSLPLVTSLPFFLSLPICVSPPPLLLFLPSQSLVVSRCLSIRLSSWLWRRPSLVVFVVPGVLFLLFDSE